MNDASSIKSTFYQSANSDGKSIKERFLIRLHEFDLISKAILHSPADGSIQHFLLLGRRGSGKSTLLKRLQVEIECNVLLKDKYIAINLAEEQANIYKLHDLLEEIAVELEHKGIEGNAPQWDESDPEGFTKKMLNYLHEVITESRKKIILLLDNIDRIFENIGHDAHLLREYLLNFSDIRIIGASTRMTEHFWKYDQPFYEFFRPISLQPLTTSEVRTLLLDWSGKFQLPKLKQFVETEPGKLETIRILTDGLPRTLQFFVNILLTKEYGTSYEYLQQVMDSVTPLYQERLNSLPPSQRKIILQLAFIWESTGTAQVAQASRMNTSIISAQLRQLEQKGLVEKLQTGTKNHLYRLSERFFNLWLIFTQGSPNEKRRTRYLTVFLENFYSEEEIIKLADEHLQNLMAGNLAPGKAALLTKILAQSRYVSWVTRDLLIKRTRQMKDVPDELLEQLPQQLMTLMDEVNSLLIKGDVQKIRKIASTTDQHIGFAEALEGLIAIRQGERNVAKALFKTSFDKGFTASAVALANVYRKDEDYVSAEAWYNTAAKHGETPRMRLNMGELYIIMEKIDLAIPQFERGIEMQSTLLLDVADVFAKELYFKESRAYFDRAINAGIPKAHTRKAITLYFENCNPSEAVKLLSKEDEEFKKTRNYAFNELLIRTWAGDFTDLYERASRFLETDSRASLQLLEQLLALGQNNLVSRLFREGDSTLKEKYLPIFYACQMLDSGQNAPDQAVPKELVQTVNKIVATSRTAKAFRDSNKSFWEYFPKAEMLEKSV